MTKIDIINDITDILASFRYICKTQKKMEPLNADIINVPLAELFGVFHILNDRSKSNVQLLVPCECCVGSHYVIEYTVAHDATIRIYSEPVKDVRAKHLNYN